MRKFYFVTGNKGKVLSLQNRLADDFVVEQIEMEIPEIQDDDVEKIAYAKAEYAFSKLGKALVVQDSAFHIEALSGFPGPYIKYASETIGAEGIIKLMEGVENRNAHFRMALAFADDDGVITTFVSEDTERGSIANGVAVVDSKKAWGEIWKAYIPSWGDGKTLAEQSVEEIDKSEKEGSFTSEYNQFVDWLKKSSVQKF